MENKNGLELTEIGLFEVGAPKNPKKKEDGESLKKNLNIFKLTPLSLCKCNTRY